MITNHDMVKLLVDERQQVLRQDANRRRLVRSMQLRRRPRRGDGGGLRPSPAVVVIRTSPGVPSTTLPTDEPSRREVVPRSDTAA